jgi:hypothetical protein
MRRSSSRNAPGRASELLRFAHALVAHDCHRVARRPPSDARWLFRDSPPAGRCCRLPSLRRRAKRKRDSSPRIRPGWVPCRSRSGCIRSGRHRQRAPGKSCCRCTTCRTPHIRPCRTCLSPDSRRDRGRLRWRDRLLDRHHRSTAYRRRRRRLPSARTPGTAWRMPERSLSAPRNPRSKSRNTTRRTPDVRSRESALRNSSWPPYNRRARCPRSARIAHSTPGGGNRTLRGSRTPNGNRSWSHIQQASRPHRTEHRLRRDSRRHTSRCRWCNRGTKPRPADTNQSRQLRPCQFHQHQHRCPPNRHRSCPPRGCRPGHHHRLLRRCLRIHCRPHHRLRRPRSRCRLRHRHRSC